MHNMDGSHDRDTGLGWSSPSGLFQKNQENNRENRVKIVRAQKWVLET